MGNNMAYLAAKSKFQVRVVNSETAYDWLMQETQIKITKTMQNMKIDVSINQVLKTALLMEHGGVMIKPRESLLVDNLQWL